MTKSLKNVKNEKCTLKDLEYVEKTDQWGKWETHMVRTGIWRENSKTWKIDTHIVEPGIW